MKKKLIIIHAFLLCALNSKAQIGEVKEHFAFPVEFGQGFINAEDFSHYLLSVSAAPMLCLQIKKMNKFRIGPVVNGYWTHPGSDWSYGLRLGYRLNKSGKLTNIINWWLYPEYTRSDKKRNLLGLGICASLNIIEISLQPQYETESQKMWLATKLAVNAKQFFKKKANNDPFEN